MKVDNDFILSEIKNRVDIQYHYKVFNEKKLVKPEWMIEAQKRENLVEQIFLKILRVLEVPDNLIISQTRVRLFDLFKEKKYRYPDFKLIKHRKSEKNLLIELEQYNSDIRIGINQAKEWINDISIGTLCNAMVINLNRFVLIFFDGKEVREKEYTIEKACKCISKVVFGEKISIDLKDINKITEKFYDQFYAIIHGGNYINIKGEKITITDENSVINNLIYDQKLKESEKIEFIYTIFNRLIFMKILMDWDLFPKIFSYLRKVPEHLIHTELNILFFKTLAVKKEHRVNLPREMQNIPFLNGGLFRITKIEKNNPDIMIKPQYLVKIFNFLEEFSFIDNGDDNSSINSEILGYVFEKTIEFRKGTGSYYTHNLICDFMCENVLYPHLLDRINSYLRTLDYKENELLEIFEEIFMLKEKTLLNIYNLIIKNIKICDICVGSGAFLLATGNLLLEIHKKILTTLNKEINETQLKQFIVEYNLYGVDFILSAIQICQLRLWLWISEESEKLLPLPNIEYNLRVGNSLLGSDSKIDIRIVNYEFINKMKEATFLDFNEPKINSIMNELEIGVISFSSLRELKVILLDLYVYSHDMNTILLKDLIESLNDLIVENADKIYLNKLKNVIKNKKIEKELTQDFLRRMKAFHWYLEFPHVFPKGFDIIIGNPPYISTKFMEKIPLEQDIQSLEKELRKRKNKIKDLKIERIINQYKEIIAKLERNLEDKNRLLDTEFYKQEKKDNIIYKKFLKSEYKWAHKIYDILVLFFERGFKLLKNNGKSFLSFIASNKFLATDYGEKIRNALLNNYQIDLLVDISMIKVFKDASVYPIIITIKNSEKLPDSKISIGRYRDINELGSSLTKITQERYYKKELKYLIYIPLRNESFELYDKMFNHPNCTTIGDEFNSYYRVGDFTHWNDFKIFIQEHKGEKLGEDYYLYMTNNNISPFQITIENPKYFHRTIHNELNPKHLKIDDKKWDLFKNELLMVKEIDLDLTCALGINYVNIGKIYNLKLKKNSILSHLSTYYFLALFNSKLLDFYFRVDFWNTHLKGGYLNYHFSYLSVLPILKIDPNSDVYKIIVVLARILEILYDGQIKKLLDLIIIHAYFPRILEIELRKFDFIKDLFECEISSESLKEILQKLEDINDYIKKLADNSLYKIILNERQFKN